MSSNFKKLILFVFFPLLFGSIFYWLTRPFKEIYFLKWLPLLSPPIDISPYVPDIIISTLPSFVWTFSMTALLILIWNPLNWKGIFKLGSIVILLSVLFEYLQKWNVVNGTFDPLDILFSLFATALVFLIFKKF